MEDSNSVYSLQVEDVQGVAREYIGRGLTEDELERVKDGIEWGFEDWEDIVRSSIWDVLHLNLTEDPNDSEATEEPS